MSAVYDFRAINGRLRGDDWWKPEAAPMAAVETESVYINAVAHAMKSPGLSEAQRGFLEWFLLRPFIN